MEQTLKGEWARELHQISPRNKYVKTARILIPVQVSSYGSHKQVKKWKQKFLLLWNGVSVNMIGNKTTLGTQKYKENL